MKRIKLVCVLVIFLILGTNELASSQWWSWLPIKCCNYTPDGVDDYLITIDVCWIVYDTANTGCPCNENCWGTITIGGVPYQLSYIDINDVNIHCCLYGEV